MKLASISPIAKFSEGFSDNALRVALKIPGCVINHSYPFSLFSIIEGIIKSESTSWLHIAKFLGRRLLSFASGNSRWKKVSLSRGTSGLIGAENRDYRVDARTMRIYNGRINPLKKASPFDQRSFQYNFFVQ